MPTPLVEWESLDLRVSGERIQAVALAALAKKQTPLESLSLQFEDGVLRVSGTARMKIPIPFQFLIRRFLLGGRTVTLPIEQMSAFGFLPVPALLTRIAGSRRAAEGINYDAHSNSIVIQLDRFLPTFVHVEVADIRIIQGGLAVRLGPGGADLPDLGGGEPWYGVET